MKNLLRLFASRNRSPRSPCPSPPPCPRCPLCLKKPSSGNVRFCAFTAPTHSGPIRGNPRLRADTCPSGPTGLGRNGQCNTHAAPPQSLHRVALCCSVLHRVAPKFFRLQMQHRSRSARNKACEERRFWRHWAPGFHDGRSRNGLLYFDGSGL